MSEEQIVDTPKETGGETPQSLHVDDTVTLDVLPIGATGHIVAVYGEGAIRRRIFDMGLTPGCEVFVRKRAPLGDPVELTLRGYELTLRKNEASIVGVRISELPAEE